MCGNDGTNHREFRGGRCNKRADFAPTFDYLRPGRRSLHSTRGHRAPSLPNLQPLVLAQIAGTYGLAVAFFGFVVTTYKRFRAMETRYTRLARRIALDESEPAVIHRSRADTGSPAAPGARTESGSHGDAGSSVEERPADDRPQQHEVSDAD